MKYIPYFLLKITYVKVWLKNLFPFLDAWSRFPALTGWCGLSAGICFYFMGIEPAPTSCSFYRILSLISILFFIFFALIFSSRLLRFTCLFALGVFISMQAVDDQHSVFGNCGDRFASGAPCRLRGSVISAPVMDKGKYTVIIRVDSLISNQNICRLNHKNILCISTNEPPAYGFVEMTGTFRTPRARENSGTGYDEYLYYMSNNLWGVFYGESIVRGISSDRMPVRCATAVRRIAKTALGRIKNEDYRGILTASFLNEKNELSDTMKNLFFIAGIYHLLALSGFNIAVLAGIMYALLFALPLKKEIKILLVLAMVWLYLVFIGFIPSLFRAVVMTTVVGLSFIFQKKNYPLNALGIAGICWLVMSPQSLFTPGYQLSFAATFGIITLSPIFNDYCAFPNLTVFVRKALRPIAMLASVSLASFLSTAPVLIYHFNQLYLFGLFANLFAVGLMALAMWVACFGFIFELLFPPLSTLCMFFAESVVHIMIQCARLVAFVPWSNIQCSLPYPHSYLIISLSLLGFILIKKGLRLHYGAIAFPAGWMLVVLCILLHSVNKETKVACFKKKNSTVVAVKWPNNRAWIIETGSEMPGASAYRSFIGPWMSEFPARKIDNVILTRWRTDAVHFLGPVLENEKNAGIVFCDSAFKQDEDCSAFIGSPTRPVAYVRPGTPIAAADQCTCRILFVKFGKNGEKTAIILRIFKSVVFFPDPSRSDPVNEPFHTQSITIGKNNWESLVD